MTTQIELQWQDEPDGDGWYWVEGLRQPHLLSYHEKIGDWVYGNFVGVLCSVARRRVAKIPGPPR